MIRDCRKARPRTRSVALVSVPCGRARHALRLALASAVAMGPGAGCTLDLSDIPRVPTHKLSSLPNDAATSSADAATSQTCLEGTTEVLRNEVPIMWDFDKPSGLSNGFRTKDGEYPTFHVFDHDRATYWLSTLASAPPWLSYTFTDAPRVIRRYALIASSEQSSSLAPRAFRLEAHDDADWVQLDARTGESNWQPGERREYVIAAPGPYREYRIVVSAQDQPGAAEIQVAIGEFELLMATCE
jgi:hypothetical protein